MNNFAPVLICTLNRHVHFKRCVESLAACTHAEKTDLFIGFDYPLKEAHWAGYEIIKAFLHTIKGFKSVNVITRDKNFGVNDNWTGMQNYVFELYDRMIVSEDDNTFAPNFLDYVNKGLDKFKDDVRITAICGYNYPIKKHEKYNYNYYYYKTFSGWGYGTWKDKYKSSYYDPKKLTSFMKNFIYALQAYKMAQNKPLTILQSIKNNQPLYGDGVVSLENIKNDMYCVYPTTTKVINSGHDGTGEHCGKMDDDIYLKQIIDTEKYFDFNGNPSLNDREISKLLRKNFNLSFKGKIATILYYLLLKLNLLNKF
jgi:hypothetical protein